MQIEIAVSCEEDVIGAKIGDCGEVLVG